MHTALSAISDFMSMFSSACKNIRADSKMRYVHMCLRCGMLYDQASVELLDMGYSGDKAKHALDDAKGVVEKPVVGKNAHERQ